MNRTNIEYLDFTWNPLAMRCDPVSAGCQNCWHRRRAKMLANNPKIPAELQAVYAGQGPGLIEDRLERPGKRIRPATIGVQFMGDLWHEKIDWITIDRVLEQCRMADWYRYLLLTKRITAAWYYFNSPIYDHPHSISRSHYLSPHIWMGISAEDQEHLDDRWNILSQISASHFWISLEPLLEPVQLPDSFLDLGPETWVVCGPETGSGARPCKKEWVEYAHEQCRREQIPFFDKSKNPIALEFPTW